MTKNIKAIAMILVIAVFTLALAGCGSDELVGKWTNAEGGYMVLNANGTAEMVNNGVSTNSTPGAKVTWEHSGNKLIIKIGAEGTDFNIPMEMNIKSLDGNKLVIEMAGVETTFTKS